MDAEQQGSSGHVSIGVEVNSRGKNWSAKVVMPFPPPTEADVARVLSLAKSTLQSAAAWVDKEFGQPVVDIKTTKP